MFTFDKVENDESGEELLIDGVYKFKIKEAVQKNSMSSGKPMIALKLVIKNNGLQHIIFDYLSSSQHEYCLKKIKDFCYSIGFEDRYNQGTFEAEDVIGKSGFAKIVTDNKVSDKFPKRRNIVSSYVIKDKPEKQKQAEVPFIDDDFPF